MGQLTFFLGLEIRYLPQGIIITQSNFTKEFLLDSGITNFKKVVTPLPINLKLQKDNFPIFHDPPLYRSLVGKLNFLTHTCPDLAYTVQKLSQYLQNPTQAHYNALQHTLHYVHSTTGQGILLHATDKLSLQAFSDSDWGVCIDTRRSVTGYLLWLGQSPISWKSKKQTIVSKIFIRS